MTFEANINETHAAYLPMQEVENICFECGEEIKKGVVRYYGHYGKDSVRAIALHPSCASIVGQRLIADGYPNRNN
ncbi:hypothetical protein GWP85_13255 [Acinetobacter beijerinckii]|uniref:hypothetical protein n=1 Tax=Acinetobacter beijerinckii TaxID=262668 RepID=UPI0023DDC1C8|nr:hypothetical protein [Acinetobacter beijerinckii]MDF2418462.1 hypothetical protein [Acinetobacter beijerinckii]